MTGTLKERPVSFDGKLMEPVMACGIKSNSIGYLVAEQDATIWRGPMASKALGRICTRPAGARWTTWWWTCPRAPAISS
jgi:Mrp family chromosome partitioning ATPase